MVYIKVDVLKGIFEFIEQSYYDREMRISFYIQFKMELDEEIVSGNRKGVRRKIREERNIIIEIWRKIY